MKYPLKYFTKKRLGVVVKPLIILIIAAFILDLAIPKLVTAQEIQKQKRFSFKILNIESIDSPEQKSKRTDQITVRKDPIVKNINRLPLAPYKKPKKTLYLTVTAYNSLPEQTDSTPCITASGLNVCEHGVENIIAVNFLPFGTMVKFPEVYGDKIFYVHDRMNTRYPYRMDVWLKDKQEAKIFGMKRLKVEIYQ